MTFLFKQHEVDMIETGIIITKLGTCHTKLIKITIIHLGYMTIV